MGLQNYKACDRQTTWRCVAFSETMLCVLYHNGKTTWESQIFDASVWSENGVSCPHCGHELKKIWDSVLCLRPVVINSIFNRTTRFGRVLQAERSAAVSLRAAQRALRHNTLWKNPYVTRMLITRLAEFDLSGDRTRGYVRLFYLALYEFTLTQIRLVNSHDSDIIAPLRCVPLLIMRQLSDTFLHQFTEQNKKVVQDIFDRHVAILAKLDDLRKKRRAVALNDDECNAIMREHHILQLKKHTCQTRSISFAFKACANVFALGNASLNPVYIMCLCMFLLRVDSGLDELYMRPYNKVNSNLRQASDENNKVIRDFIGNQAIIYECSGEAAFQKTMVRSIECTFEKLRDYDRSYTINRVNLQTECDYEEWRWLLSLFVPEVGASSGAHSDLKLALTRFVTALADYDDVQAKLNRLPIAQVDELAPPSPTSDVHVDIGRIFKRKLFTIRSGVYHIGKRPLFTIRKSLVIPSLAWVTLLGPSGSGKTTLCNLCIRSIPDAQPRRITFIGAYSDYDYDVIRRYVSVVNPHANVFDDSIHYNLTYGSTLRPEKERVRIQKYMTQFDMGHWLDKLDENALRLSTGERQRVVIIRCILHDKPIWILDEITAHLDEPCEERVLRVLKRLQFKRQKSIIHITHNRQLTKWSDYIMSMCKKDVSIRPTSTRT
jgi:energy-coupling factor transporter ATP-binding protein EcfA2